MSSPVDTLVDRECPACGRRPHRNWWTRDDHQYLQCTDCGLVQLERLPTDDRVEALYGDSYFRGGDAAGYADYEADAEVHRRNARRHLDRLEALGAGPPGQLVEVGCAAGFLLEEAMSRGWQVAGVEVSAPIRSRTAARLGVEIVPHLEELSLGDATVDVVVMNQVLEHMPDPADSLSQVARLLAPGGLLSIETWDRESRVARAFGSRWQQISPPWVVWLFGRSDLRRLVQREGLEVVRLRATWKLVSLRTVAGQLAARGRIGRVLASASRRLGIERRALPYSAGDLIVLVARRTQAMTGRSKRC